MEIIEFQKKLNQICELAEQKGKKLSGEEIRSFFEGSELDSAQLLKVIQYLKIKGILILDVQESTLEEEIEPEEEVVALTLEEEQYYHEYLNGIQTEECQTLSEALVEKMMQGDEVAREILTNRYMRVAGELAVKMNCEEIFLADLIQEANLSFWMALNEETEVKTDEWFRGRMISGIRNVIEEQTQRKFADDYLVTKVQNLEAAVKELADDEDSEVKFSVDELSVILDMDVEEIRNVLRLTGDEK